MRTAREGRRFKDGVWGYPAIQARPDEEQPAKRLRKRRGLSEGALRQGKRESRQGGTEQSKHHGLVQPMRTENEASDL